MAHRGSQAASAERARLAKRRERQKEKVAATLTLVIEYDEYPSDDTIEELRDAATSMGRLVRARLASTGAVTRDVRHE